MLPIVKVIRKRDSTLCKVLLQRDNDILPGKLDLLVRDYSNQHIVYYEGYSVKTGNFYHFHDYGKLDCYEFVQVKQDFIYK